MHASEGGTSNSEYPPPVHNMENEQLNYMETHFQNIETAFKNQQPSIQGLETQIGQLAILISERPQGSLPSDTKSNPREQLNAITIQDEEGLVAPELEPGTDHVVKPFVQKTGSKSAHVPCSSNNKGPIYEERTLRVKELDEWRTHKPKPHLNELNIPPNQLKVGDKVLLDAADPRIATSESIGEIPLMVLNIFPYGTVEVIHPKFGTFKGGGA
ncbi:hypothetical protein GOBAR_AA22905 [Gossypium barbadense]|uniref:Uncharacterized protein n=1 Tax=Gossypium barbadense TaxID=3634 RepID=A0A2P5X351_GOSBA|nr:hypothetical protein GOBAR_AA22905 [Gossypium barbadense]